MASETGARFAQCTTLPSAGQILHDYRVFADEREVRELCALEEGLSLDASWKDIVVHRLDRHVSPATAT